MFTYIYTYTCMLNCFSHIQFFATPWTHSVPGSSSMGFSRQNYWSGLPSPSPGDLPNPGIKPVSPAPPAFAGGFFTTSATWEAHIYIHRYISHVIISLRKAIVVQLLSHVWLCDPMDCSTPGFPVHHHLLELAQTHVHSVGDAIQPSHHPTNLCHPLLLLPSFFPSIRVFSNELTLHIRCPK